MASMMTRVLGGAGQRSILSRVASFLVLWPRPSDVRSDRGPRAASSASRPGLPSWQAPLMARFRDEMRKQGYIEGDNLVIDYRFAEGHFERLPALAVELVAQKSRSS
jgi:putative ABC transport system substrate-binding protein